VNRKKSRIVKPITNHINVPNAKRTSFLTN